MGGRQKAVRVTSVEMSANVFAKLLTVGTRIGADPRDSEDVRLHKFMLVMSTVMFLSAGLLWGLMYFAMGETAAGWVPFGYGLFSLLSLMIFALNGRFRFFRFSHSG